MATTSPPSPPRPPAAPPPASGQPPTRRARGDTARTLAIGALALVVLIVAYLVFRPTGGGTYHLVFAEADQLVKGDQVQVGGVPVGSVTNITLTSEDKADVTIHVDGSLAPLHQGTVAQVRTPSLSSVANRYIQLSPAPNSNAKLADGAKLPASATKEVTDLDQLFNTLNPRTRKGLRQFIQGSAEQYAGSGRAFGESVEYFSPFLSASNHFFSELVRDQPVFTAFLVETAKAVTTIAARQAQLADLVENSNTTFQAIGSQQEQLAQGLRQLPITLRQGNRTFAELPSTLTALTELVNASRPTTPALNQLFPALTGLVQTATTPVHNFKLAFSRPGPSNDLTDLVRALPELASALSTSSPSTVRALNESVPITAFFGPYTPDLAGTLRTFAQAGAYYEGNGHYAHVSPILPDFRLGEGNTLTPATPEQARAALKTSQLRRCPGAATQPSADGSSPFADGEVLTCDPSETP